MKKGTKHSDATKAKISAAKVGQPHTPEHSAAIQAALAGVKKSAAHKKAIGEAVKAAYANKKYTIGADPAVSGTDTTVIA